MSSLAAAAVLSPGSSGHLALLARLPAGGRRWHSWTVGIKAPVDNKKSPGTVRDEVDDGRPPPPVRSED